jgi:hypothetical protein
MRQARDEAAEEAAKSRALARKGAADARAAEQANISQNLFIETVVIFAGNILPVH